MTLTRRSFIVTAGALGTLQGCTALDLLGGGGVPGDIFELQPATLPAARAQSSRRLLVLAPETSAALDSDRILIRSDPLAVTYLPDARWSDSVPRMLQGAMVRTLASAGRLGFVGAQGSGPVPDVVLFTRIDAFDVLASPGTVVTARIDCTLTVLRDRDQRVLGTRIMRASRTLPDDRGETIARAFQAMLDDLLPEAMAWVLARAA